MLGQVDYSGAAGDLSDDQIDELAVQADMYAEYASEDEDQYAEPYGDGDRRTVGLTNMSLDDLKAPVATEDDPFVGGTETTMLKEDGIHDDVSLLVSIEKKYPHIEVMSMEDLSKSTAKLIADSLTNGRTIIGKSYPVYYRHSGELVELGECHQSQVKMLIRILGADNLVARLGEDKEITGKYIYALSK